MAFPLRRLNKTVLVPTLYTNYSGLVRLSNMWGGGMDSLSTLFLAFEVTQVRRFAYSSFFFFFTASWASYRLDSEVQKKGILYRSNTVLKAITTSWSNFFDSTSFLWNGKGNFISLLFLGLGKRKWKTWLSSGRARTFFPGFSEMCISQDKKKSWYFYLSLLKLLGRLAT